ncbi:MAG: prolyl oligopeptidase family serine peptidase [Candidatus Dependentiae bacterium]|nr:prolyl oligopeptidase family serine peptidase [Candidatus Dependentiae bacterium]
MKKILVFLSFFISLQAYSADYTVFAHGIVDGPGQMLRFQKAITTPKATAVQFADSKPATGLGINGIIGHCTKLFGKTVNRNAMYMGQTADITAISKTMSTKIPANKSVILYGCSRGSATIINYLAKFNPKNVKALVLDSCPASLPETIAPKLVKLGIHPSYSLSIFTRLFPAYPVSSVPPLHAIKNITNKNLPILLLHSKDDSSVPFEHSLMLYLEFKNQGFTNVHLTAIAKGKHSFLLQTPAAKSVYLKAVHTFYKKYDLPYDKALATGTCDAYNPNTTLVKQQISKYEARVQKIIIGPKKFRVTSFF